MLNNKRFLKLKHKNNKISIKQILWITHCENCGERLDAVDLEPAVVES